MNNSRFKFFLISKEELAGEARILQASLLRILTAYDKRQLNIPEMLFLIIVTVCEHRRPGQWWMKGKGEFSFLEKPSEFLSTHLQKLELPTEITSLASFFNQYRLKNLPQGVPRILYLWSAERADLELSEIAITPSQMLALQSCGRRIVTMSRKSLLAGELVDGKRDALEFLLHDMAHANLFFSETHEEQKRFFKHLHDDIKANSILEKKQSSHEFIESLHYIMSDMNSSGAHLRQSLRAAVIEEARREKNLSSNENLPLDCEALLMQQWASLQ